MMMREQQWDRSNCRHFRIDVCLHQRIYMRAFTMRAFVNARNEVCDNGVPVKGTWTIRTLNNSDLG